MTEPSRLPQTGSMDGGLHWMLKPPHCMKLPWTSPSDLDLAALALELEEGLHWMLNPPHWVKPPWRPALAFEFGSG